ncbi:MAG TPA: glycosyltransferase family 4 protein [Deltaproteobacteria bacterium]|nr:glycosyltransferase family 4 protein [Deltaproteobacteria bacterium]
MIRICMIVFSYYPDDPRPRREAEALVEKGMSVDVICLRKGSEPKRGHVNGVKVYRLPVERRRSGKVRYLYEYLSFILLSAITISVLYLRKHYHLVHIHNMPDILVLSALIPRLLGARLILDLHDPMPEVFMAKYSIDNNHVFIRVLRFMERFCIRFSDLVLTPNAAFRDLFVSRGCPAGKIHIIMNSPQESIFRKAGRKTDLAAQEKNGRFVVMYHGTIVERNGIGVALEAVARAREKIPFISFEVYGEGDYVNQFLQRISQLNLKDVVHYHGYIPAEKISAEIESADIGVVPNIASTHWDLAFPTRIFEYLCMGKPVIAPKTRGILDYFPEDSLCFFTSGNPDDLSRVMLSLYQNPDKIKKIRDRGMAIYQDHRWELQKKHFTTLVQTLVHDGSCRQEQIKPMEISRHNQG